MLKHNRFKCWQKKLKLDRLKDQRPIKRVKGLSKEESDALIKRANFNAGIWNEWEADGRAQERMEEFNAGE